MTLGYIPVTDTGLRAIGAITDLITTVVDTIDATVPQSRERSLALTAMEEASMWINKAIALANRKEAP